eukprot:TRINITY_DN16236_c0_g1_i1.p1 TRINITY_DN16236_c0_g1~~TRINITY_DN16236_c0_g1_i1.p1  ORF type:complete len:390 (+),score=59.21 TRINITY_DN16236_c0_g1_i1:142-1311(+)
MAKRGPVMQLDQISDQIDATYPSYDVSQSGSFSFRNLKLSKAGVETDKGKVNHVIDISALDMERSRPLGQGSSGRVIEAVHVPTGRVVAVKKIPITEKRQRDEIQKELLMLNQGNNDNNNYIVSVYGAYFDIKGYILIPMERMDGSLEDAISLQCEPMTELQIRSLVKQILCGLAYLHDERMLIHRDIKPANLLLNSQGFVKISDFGVAKEARTAGNISTFIGTQFFMSPERLNGDSYSFSADIWSFGVTLTFCAAGKNPWLDLGVSKQSGAGAFWEILNLISEGKIPTLPSTYSSDAHRFVRACLHSDPDERPSASQLQQDPWVVDLSESESREQIKALVAELTHRATGKNRAFTPSHSPALEPLGFHNASTVDEESLLELDAVLDIT